MSSNLIVNNIEVGAGATIYTAASNQLTFGTSGTERFRINSSGQLITGGNATPYAARSATFQNVAGQTDNYISIVAGSTSAVSGLTFGDTAAAAAGNYAGMFQYYHNGDYITYKQNAEEKLRITSTGELLQSSTGGNNKFTTKRTGAAGSNNDVWFELRSRNTADQEVGSFLFQRESAADDAYFVLKTRNTGGSNTERLRIKSDGKVGIGTATPSEILTVHTASGNTKQVLSSHAGFSELDFTTASTLRADIFANASEFTFTSRTAIPMVFRTNGTNERFRIASDGDVIIGGADAGYPNFADNLTIHDTQHSGITIRSGIASQGAVYFSDATGSGAGTYVGNIIYDHSDNHMRFATSGNERLRIKSDGDIEAGGNLKTNNLPGNNLIHNGEFAIWQRGTTSIYSSQNKYLADRFKFISSTDGNGSVHQHTNVPTVAQTGGSKFAYSLRLNCTTADTSLSTNQYINLSTRIEGRDLRHLGFGQAGTRYATLSFWQRSPNGTYHVSFRNSAYNRYYLASYTTANNTWEKHELTIPIDTGGTWATDHSMGLDITWSLGGGSGYTSGTVGSWQGSSSHAGSGQKNFFDTVGNDFYITGVQFEKGTIATPFEHKSYGEDLRQCQRYFYSITAPPGFISSTEDLGIAFASSANEIQFPMNFPVQMRATPSVEQVTGTEYFLIGQGNLGGNKFISGNFNVNNMAPHAGNLYADPDPNMSSYIGQAATIQSKNTAARLALRSDL